MYMLTNWLIDMGGISKAIYFGGLILAHFVASRMYKAALIQTLFMVQDKSLDGPDSDRKDRNDSSSGSSKRRRSRKKRRDESESSMWSHFKES